MLIRELTSIKPLSPDQQRIKFMKDRVKKDQAAVKAERARQKIAAGQKQMSDLKKIS